MRTRPPFECIALLLQAAAPLGPIRRAYAKLWRRWISIGIESQGSRSAASTPRSSRQSARRVAKLRGYWQAITTNLLLNWTAAADCFAPQGDIARSLFKQMNAAWALSGGAPGLFTLRQPGPRLQPAGCLEAMSFYETKLLKATLEQLVEFDPHQYGEMRFGVGTVNVRTGKLVRFDRRRAAPGSISLPTHRRWCAGSTKSTASGACNQLDAPMSGGPQRAKSIQTSTKLAVATWPCSSHNS